MGLVIAAATLWGLASMGLILPLVGAPRALSGTAAALLAMEFVTLLVWGYSRDSCAGGACGPGTDLARSLAFIDIPALAVALLVVTAVHGRVRARRQRLR